MTPVAGPELDVEVAQAGDCAVVAAAGEIDLSTVTLFRRGLDCAAALGRPRLLVDLARVGYLDSSAIYALLDTWNACGRRPEALRIHVARPSLAWALRLAGLGACVEQE
jgi:anti-anti-sigma factor